MSGKTSAVGWSSILATWVAIVGGLISIFMAIRAYDRDIDARGEAARRQADEHVLAAFHMLERFNEPSFVEIRSDLLEAYNTKGHCRLTEPGSPLSGQEYYTLVDYFDTAQYCIDAKLCDKLVMQQLLAPYANYWWPMMEQRVRVDRTAENGFTRSVRSDGSPRQFGFGLEELATHPVATLSPCPQHSGQALPASANRNKPKQVAAPSPVPERLRHDRGFAGPMPPLPPPPPPGK